MLNFFHLHAWPAQIKLMLKLSRDRRNLSSSPELPSTRLSCLIGLVLFKNTIHIAGFISGGVVPKEIPNSTVIVSNSEGLYE